MKIMIIEDDVALAEALAATLNDRDHIVQVVFDGQSAWSTISAETDQIDLILADIGIPPPNGLEILSLVRNNGYDIPVIIMTAGRDLQNPLIALRQGAFDFLLKPIDNKALLSSLTRADSFRSSRQEMMDLLPYTQSRIKFTIPSKSQHVKSLANSLKTHYELFCDKYDLDSYRINLCLLEALTNAIIHGNLEIDSAIKEESWEEFDQMIQIREQQAVYANRNIIINAEFNSRRIKFEIEDEGQGFDPDSLPNFHDPLNLEKSGRGLFLIHSYMDQVVWNKKGNKIQMIKNIGKGKKRQKK